MTRLIFTSFSALLLSVFLAPVANAQTNTGEQSGEGIPTIRVLNQYNPLDDSPEWQPNNAHTDPSQASTIQPNAVEPNMAQVEGQPGQTQPDVTQPGQIQPGQPQPDVTPPGQTQPGQTQPGVTQPGTSQPGTYQSGMISEDEARSLPTMRVLNDYNPRDHERDWQPNSPEHDIVSDRRTIEELRFGGQVPDNVAGESLPY